MDATIRRAGPDDVGLARAVLVEIDGRAVSGDAPIVELLADPRWYLLFATIGETVVGGLWGASLRRGHRPEPEFMLYEMGVREDHRGQGIGRALVEAFKAEARAAGAHEVWVLTNASNTRAMAMYAAAGMTRPNPDDVMLSVSLD
jgi:ribosomal protein S18 acetylase RimI-like enzyme